MKKQTAVEWLFAHLLPFLEFSDPKEREHFRKCLAEAKAMEKEQMEEAVSNAISKADMVDNRGYFNFDKWYNETYGDEK
jgi:hypothetical protein